MFPIIWHLIQKPAGMADLLFRQKVRVSRKPEMLGGELPARCSKLHLLRERILTYVIDVSNEANDADWALSAT